MLPDDTDWSLHAEYLPNWPISKRLPASRSQIRVLALVWKSTIGGAAHRPSKQAILEGFSRYIFNSFSRTLHKGYTLKRHV